MTSCRPPLFHKRWFEPTVNVTCVRFYLRFALSLRDVKELMAEPGLTVDHTTIWRWTQAYGPEIYRRLQGAGKRKSSTWHMDETFVRVGGRWMYLFRAVDSTAKGWTSTYRKLEIAKPQSSSSNVLWPIPTNRRGFSLETDCAAIRLLFANCNRKVTSIAAVNNEPSDTVTTALNRITVT